MRTGDGRPFAERVTQAVRTGWPEFGTAAVWWERNREMQLVPHSQVIIHQHYNSRWMRRGTGEDQFDDDLEQIKEALERAECHFLLTRENNGTTARFNVSGKPVTEIMGTFAERVRYAVHSILPDAGVDIAWVRLEDEIVPRATCLFRQHQSRRWMMSHSAFHADIENVLQALRQVTTSNPVANWAPVPDGIEPDYVEVVVEGNPDDQ